MNITSTSRALVLLLAGLTAGVHTTSASDDTLARAKGLYASAAYDEALAVLDRLQSETPVEDPTSIAEYRVFCLLALDRRDEARKNIDRILHDNPLYLPSPDQASPRIQSVFRDVRRQSLPKIVMERYAAAKAAFERKDSSAAQQFDDLLALLDDPDVQEASALSDLRAVASAFRDLTKALAASPPPIAGAGIVPQAAIAQAPDVIYTAADADVIPPVAQSQRVPQWRPSPNEAVREFTGALRLLIDQSGAVVSATMSASTRPAYDQLLLKAARDWKFAPARKQGMPVRYLKLIEIRLKADAP
jgi:tetratricopeptide (TPR) repeat protein